MRSLRQALSDLDTSQDPIGCILDALAAYCRDPQKTLESVADTANRGDWTKEDAAMAAVAIVGKFFLPVGEMLKFKRPTIKDALAFAKSNPSPSDLKIYIYCSHNLKSLCKGEDSARLIYDLTDDDFSIVGESWLICIEDMTFPHKFIGTSRTTAFQNFSEHKHLVPDNPGFERRIL